MRACVRACVCVSVCLSVWLAVWFSALVCEVRLDILFSLIWIQTVCKDYQQTTLRVQATLLLYKINNS